MPGCDHRHAAPPLTGVVSQRHQARETDQRNAEGKREHLGEGHAHTDPRVRARSDADGDGLHIRSPSARGREHPPAGWTERGTVPPPFREQLLVDDPLPANDDRAHISGSVQRQDDHPSSRFATSTIAST